MTAADFRAYCLQKGYGHHSYCRIYNIVFTPCTCLTLRTSRTATTYHLAILHLAQCLQGVHRNNFTLLLRLHDSVFSIYNLPQNFQERIWTIKITIITNLYDIFSLIRKNKVIINPIIKRSFQQTKTNRRGPNQPTNRPYSKAVAGK
jgi:hypothetical protein